MLVPSAPNIQRETDVDTHTGCSYLQGYLAHTKTPGFGLPRRKAGTIPAAPPRPAPQNGDAPTGNANGDAPTGLSGNAPTGNPLDGKKLEIP